MKILFKISRIFVGVIFTFSGFVKAVDPMGYAIKIQDYFTAFQLESLSSTSLILAILISSLEFLTGIHLLLGFRLKTYSLFALIFMIIFTPLTLGIAIFDPVSDCGCFGDAIKLGNWQTFFKNLIFLIPTVFIFLHRKKFPSQLSLFQTIILSTAYISLILFISIYSLKHLPIIDFRPFKIGNNIQEQMTLPEGAEMPEFETTFILEKNGKKEEFTTENYPYSDSTWIFIETITKTTKEGFEPPIHDFVLIDEQGEDQTDFILNNCQPVLLIISHKVEKGEWENVIDKIAPLRENSDKISSYILTSSLDEDIKNFSSQKLAGFKFLTADQTLLKTIIRSNPGAILLQNGTIVGKWHYNDIPDFKKVTNPISFALNEANTQREKMIYLLLLLGTIVFTTSLYSFYKK